MLKKVREALSMSVAVLDTMFEPVEIQASDSEIESEDDKQWYVPLHIYSLKL